MEKSKPIKLKDQYTSATKALAEIYRILNADTFPQKKFIKTLLLSAIAGATTSFRPKIWGMGINAATGDAGLGNPQVAIFGGLAYLSDIFNGFMTSQKTKITNEMNREIFINFEEYCRIKYLGEDKMFRNDNPLPAFNQAKTRARQSVQSMAYDIETLTNATVKTATSGAILWTISPAILAGVLLYATANIGWNYWHESKIRPLRKKFNKKNDQIYAAMGDIATNTDTIQRTGNEKEYAKAIKDETMALKRYWQRISELSRKHSIRSMFTNTFFSSAVFGISYGILTRQKARIGDLVTLIDSVGQFSNASINMGNLFTSVKRNLTEYQDAMEVLEHIPVIKDKEDAIEFPVEELTKKLPDIEFDNVTLRYKEDQPDTFTDFNLKIPGGQKIAILGDSGAGKTSLMSLLLREYEPSSGEIRIANYKNDDVKIRSLRKLITYIPQNSGFLDRSFRDNLKLVKPNASDEEIKFSLAKAKLLDLVESRPDGLNSSVGHSANTLSGGEQQRLSLARAFLAPSPIVVMDEPEKGLDPKLRGEVLQNIKNFGDQGDGRTMIIITHDPFIAQSMDRVIILEKGKIIEDGRPQDLLQNKSSHYASLRQSFAPGIER